MWPFRGNLTQRVKQELATIPQESLFTALLVRDLNDIVEECIIELCNPQAAAELCVIERAGLHHSLHGRLYEPRERQNERERQSAKEGGGETPYWQNEWYIIWLSWTELLSLTAVPHSPTVLHFTRPGALIYHIQQNCHRLDVFFSPCKFPNFLPRWVFHEGLILLFFSIYFSLFHFRTQMRSDRAS